MMFAITAGLPGSEERATTGGAAWFVRGKLYAWECHPWSAAGVALVTLRSNVWYDGPVALLDELYVALDRRSRGLGAAMIRLLIADAEEQGVSAIEINVDAQDIDAQRFYERQGFSGADPSPERTPSTTPSSCSSWAL